jgi:hypothetical protein
MRHLSPEELLDLADGTRAETSVAHLAQCAACREQLVDLRATMALTMTADVPEPSPLFWDHLSERVRASVAAENTRPRPSIFFLGFRQWSWQSMAAAGAAVAGVVALAITMRTGPGTGEGASTVQQPSHVASASLPQDPAAASTSDASLALLTDLAGELDWDSVADAGMTMGVGAADEAVHELNNAERAELQRLLREAMAGA